jgi:predicted glutamine amidotransferase
MCRMIGVIAREPVAARPFLNELATQSRDGSEAPHGDGFGAAIFTGGHWLHVREQCPAWEVSLAALGTIEGTLMLLHSRKASDPATINLTKLHPFCADHGPGVMFCQNGTIRQPEKMRTHLDDSAIDTEKYFDVLTRHYKTSGDFGKAFLGAAEEIKSCGADPTSLNALVSDGKELVAYKGEILAENCCYHTLFVREKPDISVVSTEPFQGEEEGKWRALEGVYRRAF